MLESLLIASFVAGFLTVLAPCILPLLPVVIGGSLTGTSKIKRNPYTIISALLISIIVFTLIIHSVSSFFYVPETVWSTISGTLILFVGLTFIFPKIWTHLPFTSKFSIASNKALGKGIKRSGFWGDAIIGVSLGPIFTSCSPTYFIILAVVLPNTILVGIVYLLAYVLGLGVILLFIALIGQAVVEKLGIFASDNSKFKLVMGILMIIIAIAIYTGYNKKLTTQLLDGGFIDVTKYELEITK